VNDPRTARLRRRHGDQVGSIAVEDHGAVLVARITGTEHAELVPGVVKDLSDLVDLADGSDAVRAVVLTGTHPDRFIAHASVGWLQEGSADTPDLDPRAAALVTRAARLGRAAPRAVEHTRLRGAVELLTFHDTLLRMNASGAVFVAALNGSALGGGCELALACDLRVMADGPYMFGQPEVIMGILPGGGGTQRLPRLIGAHKALKHILTGAPMSPAEALACGAVDSVVAPEDLLGAAVGLAAHLGSREKASVGALKRCVHLGASMELEDGLALERTEFLRILSSTRSQELMRAHEASAQAHGELPLYRPEVYRQAVQTGVLPDGEY
jgi:enoyl-CoA hydratase